MYKKPYAMALLVLLAFTPACDQIKKVDNMNRNTEEMNATTKGLYNKTSEGMDKTGQQMDQMISKSDKVEEKMSTQLDLSRDLYSEMKEAFDQGRLKNASDERRANIEVVKTTRSMCDKINAATKYLISFEYQLWTGIGLDKDIESRREALMAEAVRDFFTTIKKFRMRTEKVNPFASSSVESREYILSEEEDNLDASFSAISAALHEVNRVQKERIKNITGMQATSMLSMITQGLMAKADLNLNNISLESLPEWKRRVLENEDLALELLQARHNILTLIGVSKIIPPGFSIKKAIAAMNIKTIEFPFEMHKYNLAQINEIYEFFKLAVDTRDILKVNLGITPDVNSGVSNFSKGIIPTYITLPGKQSLPQMEAYKKSIQGLLNRLKQNS